MSLDLTPEEFEKAVNKLAESIKYNSIRNNGYYKVLLNSFEDSFRIYIN